MTWIRDAAVGSALCVLLLAGCVRAAEPDPGEPPAPAASSAPATSAPAASTPTPTTSAGVDLTVFRSESTACQYDAPGDAVAGIGCQMMADYTYDVPEAWLDFDVPCSSIWLGYDASDAELGCASDVAYEAAMTMDPLPPGTVVQHGGIGCTVLEVGVTCTNAVGAEMTITPERFVAHAG